MLSAIGSPTRIEQSTSLADYLDQHSFSPFSVEFAVENLFPRPEIEFALRDCHDDFATHDLTLQMGVGVVFASSVVFIGTRRRVRRQLFQPQLIVAMKIGFVVVDEDRSGNVHGVDQAKAFGHAALANEFIDLRRDVDEPTAIRHFEPKMFSERFQFPAQV
jgi:hypothetical protein